MKMGGPGACQKIQKIGQKRVTKRPPGWDWDRARDREREREEIRERERERDQKIGQEKVPKHSRVSRRVTKRPPRGSRGAPGTILGSFLVFVGCVFFR